MSDSILHRHCFASMGSEVEILLLGEAASDAGNAFALAESLAGEWMRTFNRFHPESELSRLNSATGGFVSARLFDAIRRAVEAARISRGAFNPLILPALVAAGYDRSFEDLASQRLQPLQDTSVHPAEHIVLDSGRRWVQLPDGAQLDLGGIAKGLYADELAQRLADWPGGIVSAGGDMRIWGEGPDGGAWAIGVEPPDQGEHDLAVVLMQEGGIATSGINRRSWKSGDTGTHHLISPRTGRPVVSETVSVTVIAPTAATAEIAATSLYIDPDLAADGALPGIVRGAIVIDSHGRSTSTRFDQEAAYHVYLNG